MDVVGSGTDQSKLQGMVTEGKHSQDAGHVVAGMTTKKGTFPGIWQD